MVAYNMKRLTQILGAGPLIAVLRGRRRSRHLSTDLPRPAVSFYTGCQ